MKVSQGFSDAFMLKFISLKIHSTSFILTDSRHAAPD